MTELVRLSGLCLSDRGSGGRLTDVHLRLRTGDACCICTDCLHDGHLLLRGIATLAFPEAGQLFFRGRPLDFSDRQALLAYKRAVGYVAADATLISRATVFENLMLMRYYFENSLTIQMSEQARSLCAVFGLENRLNRYPWQLDPEEARLFMIIRELAKDPLVLLLERPADFLRTEPLEALQGILGRYAGGQAALVLLCGQKGPMESMCNKQINIFRGRVSTCAHPRVL
ncbi:MAG: hypothetical protein JRI36_10750 [Deltaproteobacteria bacterium]|nr:hypothetical protein [Deltaproteobacteria bacterium]